MCAYAHVHMHARIHATPYGSEMCNSHQLDPQMWGGLYPSQKMVSTRSSLYSFLVRTRTGGEPREIAEVCAPPVREPKMAGAGRSSWGPQDGPMNRGVRVGAASITDEPEKTPATQLPDLLPTTYYLLPLLLLLLACLLISCNSLDSVLHV